MAQVNEGHDTPKEREAILRLIELNAQLMEKTNQLAGALDSRVVIEQAKGVLAARHEIDLQTAFDVLRRGARSHQLKLRDLAQRVITEPATPREIARYLD
jgi:AmiR/NasT family two-component response regulator